mgnify:FL=1
MIGCTVQQLCNAVGGTLLQESGAVVTEVSTDSRSIPAGALFVPLVGERFDGHDYLDAALAGGAAGCLTAKKPISLLDGKFYIQVPDTLKALKALAAWYRDKFTIPMVQVTGSAGKTTTKEMIAAVLSQRFSTLKTQANFNNAIGTPLTLLNLAPEHQAAVIETGMNHFGEIRYLGEMVRPTVAVITNVGDAHIENLGGTRQGILQAKCEIFENGDDELLSGLTLPFETVLCGQHKRCGVRVANVAEHGIDGVTCTVTTVRDVYEVSIPSPGAYMIYPAAMAIAIGEHLGLTKAEMLAGIAAYRPVGSRMHLVRCSNDRIIIDDCYNANPQAMAEALRILAQTEHPRRMAVLGDMGELGDLTEQAHRDMGTLARTLGLNTVVAIGPKAKAIQEADPDALWFPTVTEALPAIRAAFTAGTAVLVKASHAMHFTDIVKDLEATE